MRGIKRRPLVLKVPNRLLLRLTSWSTRCRCGSVCVSSAMALTTNTILRLSGTQWLGQGSLAQRKGSDQNQLLWLSGTQ